MTLRAVELLAVANEVAGVLAGRPLQKVAQPDGHTLVLGFPASRRMPLPVSHGIASPSGREEGGAALERNGSSGGWLLISVDRRHGRVHLLDEKPPGSGEAAPPFCMLLRKELVGARLASVEAVAGERACAFEFARGGEVRRLLVFLYGSGAQVVLVDGEGRPLGRIGAAKAVAGERIELPPPRADDRPSRFEPVRPSAAIAEFYGRAQEEAATSAARETAMGQARRALERLRRREAALAGDLARIASAEQHRRHADLIFAHLDEIPRGVATVTLPDDFAGGEPLAIALDPSRSAKDNAARFYREWKRLHRARVAMAARLDETRAERRLAEERLAALPTLPAAALPSVGRPKPKPARRGESVRRPPYRVYRSTSGAEILVGRSAARNDELTFRVARGGDLWLHARDFAGSHVVVPLAGRPVDEATLIDGALLAVYFSAARPKKPAHDTADQFDVTYALRKYVRKPRGAAPGRVSVGGAKTLRVRLDRARLQRLLASVTDE